MQKTFLASIALATLLIAGCGSTSSDPANSNAGTATPSGETLDSIVFDFETIGKKYNQDLKNIAIDCTNKEWSCVNDKYAGQAAKPNHGFGLFDAKEIFKDVDQVDLLLKQPGWEGTSVTKKYELGDGMMHIVEGASNGRTYMVYITDIGERRYQCMGNFEAKHFDKLSPEVEEMCQSMREA